jgi:hypothetical protein
MLVLRALLDHKVQSDHRVRLVLKVLQVHRALLAHRALQDHKAQLVLREVKAQSVRLDRKVLKVL